MMDSMQWTLIFVWAGFFGFLNEHQRHIRDFRGASAFYFKALHCSFGLGMLTLICALIYSTTQLGWYDTFIIFVAGSFLGPLLLGLLGLILGQLIVSPLAFLGWPMFACIFFYTIKSIQN